MNTRAPHPLIEDRPAIVLLAIFAAAKILAVLATLLRPEYGFFRDEFYYLACTDRLAAGYVDHPPLSIWLLAAWKAVAGDSLVSLRMLTGLLGAGTVVCAGLFARQLGAGVKAVAVACALTFCIPMQLGVGSFYSMNILEYVFVPLLAWMLLRILQGGNPRQWIWFGLVLGLGIMNKHTLVILTGTMFIGMLLTPARRHFATKQFWLGIALAAVLVLPNVLWQVTHGFLSAEFYARASALKNVPTSPVKIILDQIMLNNPLTFLFWMPGLLWFLRGDAHKEYRTFGIAYLLMLLMMIAAQSNRADRIASFIPVLIAGGVAATERFAGVRRAGWIIPGFGMAGVVAGIVLAPAAIPMLTPEATSSYVRRLGFDTGFEQGVRAELPQNLADRFGWKELADSVRAVYRRLPPNEQTRTVLVGRNYGEAGSLEYYGRSMDLPRVISGHNSYWLWGPGEAADVYIIVGNPRSRLEQLFDDVQEGGRTFSGWQMNYERNTPIWICRKPRMSMKEIWPDTKFFI